MPRPITGAWFVRLRGFSSTTLSLTRTHNTPSNHLLSKNRVLTTRVHCNESFSLSNYALPQQPLSDHLYATLFHECARHGWLLLGQALHAHMLSHSQKPDLFVTNHLINMYAKCGALSHALKVFDEMPVRNVVSWTSLVSGYSQYGMANECLRLFCGMLVNCRPNEFAFASVISCCNYETGKQLHCVAFKMGLSCSSIYVGNVLITMYSKSSEYGNCRGIDEAWSVFETMEFRNVVSWNSMIRGCQILKLGLRGILIFSEMVREGIGFDRATLLSLLSSFGGEGDDGVELDCVLQLHCVCIKSGFVLLAEVATALVKAYADTGGEIVDCHKLFSESGSSKDIVLWTSVITVFAEQQPEEALFLFRRLLREGFSPDWFTFSIVLKACAGLVTERSALAVHSQVSRYGFGSDTVIANTLIHAYARCGAVHFSRKVFDELRYRNVVSWNSMLKAYALHGQAKEALHLFSEMEIHPDSATMVALLSACSHAGLVDEGKELFNSMSSSYGIKQELDHYACMVDTLGRAGFIFEAEKLISKMPMEPDSVIWSALLGSCRKHGEAQLASLAADRLKELSPENSLAYVQMSNMYSSSGNYNEAGLVRKEMKGSKVKKEPGLSFLEIGNRVHEFASGGRRHSQREAICNKLDALIMELKEIGYVPETSLALFDIEEEHKEEQLYHHSEKLALAFAMMNEAGLSGDGSVIRIAKNIRVCVDCHNFMKLASDHLKKEILLRDSNRFHHFKNKVCSCNDYW